MPCCGAQPSGAWRFFVKNGVPTGGDYADVGAGTTCKPYTLAACFHHGENPDNVRPPPDCDRACCAVLLTSAWVCR